MKGNNHNATSTAPRYHALNSTLIARLLGACRTGGHRCFARVRHHEAVAFRAGDPKPTSRADKADIVSLLDHVLQQRGTQSYLFVDNGGEFSGRILDLITYLRAAMPLMRDTSSTLAQEIDLARAYLDIVRLRVGERLSVRTQMPPDAAHTRMPPMMAVAAHRPRDRPRLRVPNAQGTISIVARVFEQRLLLTITDSGAGLVPDTSGDGVATIRERLSALYGKNATLDLRRSEGRSTEALLDLPLEWTPVSPTNSHDVRAGITQRLT